MIGKILGSGQLGKLASFVSPAFFDVMPAKQLWAKARRLFSQTRDQEAFRLAVAARGAELAGAMPNLEVVADKRAVPKPAPTPPDPAWRGQLVTELFFRQLFSNETTLLDLRAQSFTPSSNRLVWHPAAWLAEWAPEFIGALREIYRGFYAHDDAMFRAGLEKLSLGHSEDLFRKHFGGGQDEVRFRTVDFVDTFHQVFVRCKENGTSLHPDFLPLGIYLAALYDHLEELSIPIDVARAFAQATSGSLGNQETIHA